MASSFQVLVWHTQTEKRKVPNLRLVTNLETNLHKLLNDMSSKGLANISNRGTELKICKNVKGCD